MKEFMAAPTYHDWITRSPRANHICFELRKEDQFFVGYACIECVPDVYSHKKMWGKRRLHRTVNVIHWPEGGMLFSRLIDTYEEFFDNEVCKRWFGVELAKDADKEVIRQKHLDEIGERFKRVESHGYHAPEMPGEPYVYEDPRGRRFSYREHPTSARQRRVTNPEVEEMARQMAERAFNDEDSSTLSEMPFGRIVNLDGTRAANGGWTPEFVSGCSFNLASTTGVSGERTDENGWYSLSYATERSPYFIDLDAPRSEQINHVRESLEYLARRVDGT